MTSFPTRLALTAALAAIAALVIPTAAGATVASEVKDSTLTLTSNVDSAHDHSCRGRGSDHRQRGGHSTNARSG
jgi:hypothetical protein